MVTDIYLDKGWHTTILGPNPAWCLFLWIKFCWNRHAYLLTPVCGCFCTIMAELKSCVRGHMANKDKTICYLILYRKEKFTNSCARRPTKVSLMYFFFFRFWSCCAAYGILVPLGSNPCPLHWKHRVLTTRPPGKSLIRFLSKQEARKIKQTSRAREWVMTD